EYAIGNGVTLALHSGGKQVDHRGAIKLAFGTPDVAGQRTILTNKGATMGPVRQNGTLALCDGFDPEGNIFQLSNRGMERQSSAMLESVGADGGLVRAAREAITKHPDVFVYTLDSRPEHAVIFRDVWTRLSQSHTDPIPQEQMERALHVLGCVGMMAQVRQRRRRVVVFAPSLLPLEGGKQPLPGPLELASEDQFPLG
ncbi:MAG: hypothetical protein ABI743_02485, partial [bacterium]